MSTIIAPGTDRLLDFTEVGKRLGLSADTVRRMADRDPAFPSVVYVLPRKPRIKASELATYIESLPAGSQIDAEL